MKIYLAGPFFNNQERKNINKAKQILRNKGLAVFVPMEHKLENDHLMPNDVWGKKVFEMDRDAIFDCDIIVALYYGLYSDSGTAWEIGFGNCLNKKIVIVHTGEQVEKSLMVVNGSNLNISSIEQLNCIDFENLQDYKNCFKVEQK